MLLRSVLLEGVLERRTAGRTDRDGDAGSALASVVGVLAITGVVTASLLTATMFGTEASSATRAHVQALTAAEGGLDAAKATLPTCATDPVTSAEGASPRFGVEIWHRATETGAWDRGCPPTDSVQVKLVSTGHADMQAINGQVLSNTTTMESVVRKVPALFAGRGLTVGSAFSVNPTGPTDVVVNGDYGCEGAGASLTHTGIFLLGDEYPPAGSCRSQGFLRTAGDYDETSAVNAYPRYTASSVRFSHMGGVDWNDIPNTDTPGHSIPCTLTGGAGGSTTITSSGGHGRIDSQVDCPDGLTVDPLWNLEFVLGGDVTVFVEKFTLRGTLTVRSGDGKEHSLTIVRPWTATEDCLTEADVQLAGGTVVQSDGLTRVMLYSSNAVEIGQDPAAAPVSRPTQSIRGQVYGCDIRVWDDTTLTYAPAGAVTTPRPWSAVELLSKRDVAE